MTRTENQLSPAQIQAALEQIIAELGLWGLSRAVIARIFTRRKQRLRHADELSEHLRRDVGLGPHRRDVSLGPLHLAQPRHGQLYY